MALSDDVFGLAGRLTSAAIKGAVIGCAIAAAWVALPVLFSALTGATAWSSITFLGTGGLLTQTGALVASIGGGWGAAAIGAAVSAGLSVIPGVDTFKTWFASANNSMRSDPTPYQAPARPPSIAPTPTRPRLFENDIAQDGAGSRLANAGSGKTAGHSL